MLDDVARHTRAGRSVPAALATALADRPELATWFPGGAPAADLPTEAALASRAIGVAAASPSNAADTCERAARAIRDRRAVTAERAAQSAPARLSARVMTVLPLGVAVWSIAVDPTVRKVLLTTPLGWVCLAGGLGLNLAGRWWTNRLVAGGRV
jgi:tight adherence protein B